LFKQYFMELSDLMLKKEEVPILHEINFQLPICPMLINPGIKIDPSLASKVFPQAARGWYDDLEAYVETAELDDQKREWYKEVFLKKKPEVKKEFGRQNILNGSWREDIVLDGNGFARGFSISRDFGGSTYFNKGERGCRTFVPFQNNKGPVLFSEEKAKEFGFKEMDLNGGQKGALVHVYALHNVANYSSALFLRNWGILYLNEALKSAIK